MTRKNISFISGHRVADTFSTLSLTYKASGYEDVTTDFRFKVRSVETDDVVFETPSGAIKQFDEDVWILYLDMTKPLKEGEYIVDIYFGKEKVFTDPINIRFIDVADFVTKVIEHTDLDVREYPVGSIFYHYTDDVYLYVDTSKRLTALGSTSTVNPSLEGLSNEEVQEVIRQVLSAGNYATVEEVRNMLTSHPTGSLLSPEQLLKIDNAITEIPEEYVTEIELERRLESLSEPVIPPFNPSNNFENFLFPYLNDLKTNGDAIWGEAISKAKADKTFIIESDWIIETVLTSGVDFRDIYVRLPQSKFILKPTVSVTLGGNANIDYNPSQHIGTVSREGTGRDVLVVSGENTPSVLIMGAKGQNISIDKAEHIRLVANESTRKTYSIAYNNFRIQRAFILELFVETSKAWINENIFHLNRIEQLRLYGEGHPNANLFIGGTFEQSNAKIEINKGTQNRFLHTRMENLGTLKFGEGTSFNIIEKVYFGTIQTIGRHAKVFEDLGSFNDVRTPIESTLHTQHIHHHVTEEPFTSPTAYTAISQSRIFEMKGLEDFLVIDLDNTESDYLVWIEMFSLDGTRKSIQELNYGAGWLTKQVRGEDISQPSTINRIKGGFRGGKGYGEYTFSITDPGYHYIAITIGSNGDLSKQLSKRFSVDLYSKRPRLILEKPHTNT